MNISFCCKINDFKLFNEKNNYILILVCEKKNYVPSFEIYKKFNNFLAEKH